MEMEGRRFCKLDEKRGGKLEEWKRKRVSKRAGNGRERGSGRRDA